MVLVQVKINAWEDTASEWKEERLGYVKREAAVNIHRSTTSIARLERQVSKMINSDTCPRPTTHLLCVQPLQPGWPARRRLGRRLGPRRQQIRR